ncbi:15879_t:CDS:1, partial [Funneliformis mosseae]
KPEQTALVAFNKDNGLNLTTPTIFTFLLRGPLQLINRNFAKVSRYWNLWLAYYL